MAAAKRDIYQEVTDRIVAALEAGTTPWTADWTGPACRMPVRSTGQGYRGVNVILLWLAGKAGGYTSHRWITFAQALAEGGSVKKGQKGTTVVFFKMLDKDNAKTGKKDRIPLLRHYTVFNTEQCDNVLSPPGVTAAPVNPDAQVAELEAFYAQVGADVRHHPTYGPAYSPPRDVVMMPSYELFHSAESYYGTLAHEHVHWTGHQARLNRHPDGWSTEFGSPQYSKEELVAELGAAFVCAALGVTNKDDRAASYIASFLKLLKSDKRAVFTAATAAATACDYLLAKGGRLRPADPEDADAD